MLSLFAIARAVNVGVNVFVLASVLAVVDIAIGNAVVVVVGVTVVVVVVVVAAAAVVGSAVNNLRRLLSGLRYPSAVFAATDMYR